MIIAALFATYTTFGPIAQDASYLYIADHGSIVRVDKSDPTQRLTLTAPVDRRIAAIDVDGDRVYYGTAPAPQCTAVPTFPPQTAYVHYNCALNDTIADHELRSVSIFGGDDKVEFSETNGITEITHDENWIYWLAPSSGIFPMSATIRRKNTSNAAFEQVAAGLIVSAIDLHPLALTSDAVYVVSGGRLLRYPKSQSPSPTDVTEVNVDSAIASLDDTVYFVDRGRVYALDSRSGNFGPIPFAVTMTAGATYPDSILGAAPGVLVAAEGSGWTHTAFRGWIVSDLCAGSAQLLASTTSDVFHAYFIAPWNDPAFAVDSDGVYSVDRRVSPLSGCGRRRVVRFLDGR